MSWGEDEEAPRLPERYEDLGSIGIGGMGQVRRIRDLTYNRVLALKTLHRRWSRFPGTVARFVSEAQVTAQLQHPGIAAVYDMGNLPDGRYYYTMRLVEGADLGAWLGSRGLPPGRLRPLLERFVAASKAVAYAHTRGVVHRDLKPANILLGEFGDVVVIDWGLARILPGAADPVVTVRSADPRAKTRVGSVGGTRGYMPPEQAAGDIDAIGPWTDTWALGAILGDLLVGLEPVRPVLEEPSVPEGLRAIVDRALRPNPTARYPTAAALAADLEAWLEVPALPVQGDEPDANRLPTVAC